MPNSRSQWPRGLRRRSAAARPLRLWVRIPSETWMFVCCECCVLSGRGLCDGLITCPEESYQLWCVFVCDLETSWMRRPWPDGSRRAKNKQNAKQETFQASAAMSMRSAWRLKIGPIRCSETSVRNYHYTLHTEPERRRFQETLHSVRPIFSDLFTFRNSIETYTVILKRTRQAYLPCA